MNTLVIQKELWLPTTKGTKKDWKKNSQKIDPATLEYLEQLLAENAPAVRKVVQNVLDEPISQETQKSLQNPLLPKPYQPRPPSRQRKSRKTQALLSEFDPFPARKTRTVKDYEKEILDLFDDAEKEGERHRPG